MAARSTGLLRARLLPALLLPAAVLCLVPAAARGAGPRVEEVAVLETGQGRIVWRFFPDAAPGHVAYVKELIRRGFYDGTALHRVIPHFVVQGGDPNSKNDDRGDDGEGEGDRRLKAEFSTVLHYRPGTVGMARDADPDSGSCQFFIALENLPRLDGRYTIFGEVIEGLDVARRIADLPRDLNDNPLRPVRVTASLATRPVPAAILSGEAGESGETVTGPLKPRPYDPKNVLWQPPRLGETIGAGPNGSGLSGGEGARAGRPPRPARLEVAVGEDGAVLDVRFPALDAADPERWLAAARAWRFLPALYEGRPRKVRFEIDSDGGGLGPPTGGGAPIEPGGEIAAPKPAVRVDLPPGRKPPDRSARLRLTLDAAGAVVDAALQAGCGDADLDAAAVAAAKRLVFQPATRPRAGRKDAEPVAVYLNVEARFLEPGS